MKILNIIPILVILSLNLSGQTVWEKYSGNPVMTAGPEVWEDVKLLPGSVINYEGNYRMWYSGGDFYSIGGDFLIGHATSPDGISWTKDVNNPVLENGITGEWDDRGVYNPAVLLDDTIFHMWFSGNLDDIPHAIGHATSKDGVTWLKDENNPVLERGSPGEWDDRGFASPTVIYDGNDYHMYYSAHSETSPGNFIGHATSPDGRVWTKDPGNPILSPGEIGSWDYDMLYFPSVVFDDNTYHMWYAGGRFIEYDIGYATSEDGSTWTKHEVNPVLLKGDADSWESAVVSITAVIIDSSKFKMWYRGQGPDGTGGIGYAESDTRVPYVLVVENKPFYDSTDTVVAEIVLDGTIYIVPEGTSILVDSIIKYSMASADVLANTETEIPLTDLSVGKYSILGVTSMGFVSTNPYLLEVVENARPPDLTLEDNTVKQGDTIYVTSNKDGTIYLVVTGTTPENFVKGRVRDSVQVSSDNLAEIYTVDLYPKDYLLYAVDNYGQFSASCVVTVKLVDGIENNIAGHFALFPNPVEDLLTVQASFTGSYLVEITSMNGQLIHSEEMEGAIHQLDLSSFQKGVYLITIRSKDFVATRKIIKL